MLLNFETEAKSLRPRPRLEVTRPRPGPKFWPWGQFCLSSTVSVI